MTDLFNNYEKVFQERIFTLEKHSTINRMSYNFFFTHQYYLKQKKIIIKKEIKISKCTIMN